MGKKKTKFNPEFDRIPYKGSEVVKVSEPGVCWHCGEFTSFIDISFGAFLCSEECSDAKWQEYFDASHRM